MSGTWFHFLRAEKNDTALVLDTFEGAFLQCYDGRPLVHSDRGTQYTSDTFRKRLEQEGICRSISRSGKRVDNGSMEGFWGILKTEMYDPHHFEKYGDLCEAIAVYINFYNNERYHKKLAV